MIKGTKKYKLETRDAMIREIRTLFATDPTAFSGRTGRKLFYSRAAIKLNNLGYKDPYGDMMDRVAVKRLIYSSIGTSGLTKNSTVTRKTTVASTVNTKVPDVLRCIILDESLKPMQRLKMFESWFEV